MRSRQEHADIAKNTTQKLRNLSGGEPYKPTFVDDDRIIFLGHKKKTHALTLHHAHVASVDEKDLPLLDSTGIAKKDAKLAPWTELATFPDEVDFKALSKEEILLRERKRQSAFGITTYSYDEKHRKLLVPTPGGPLWTATLPEESLPDEPITLSRIDKPIGGGDASSGSRSYPTWSSDGRLVGFARNGDLWVLDSHTGAERQLTFCRKRNRNLTAGVADYITQEEFDRYTGFYWCPHEVSSDPTSSSYRILYSVSDVSRVPTVHVASSDVTADVDEYAYPRVGETNCTVHIRVCQFSIPTSSYSLDSAQVSHFELQKESFNFVDHVEYIPRFGWGPTSSSIYVQVLDRRQCRTDLALFDISELCPLDSPATDFENDQPTAISPAPRVITEEKSDVWINIGDMYQWLSDGSLLFSSERHGYRHLYLFRAQKDEGSRKDELPTYGEPLRITSGEWVVDTMFGVTVDEDRGLVFFTGSYDSPVQKHLYVTTLDENFSNAPLRLTDKRFSHKTCMNKSGTRYLTSFSNLHTRPTVAVFRVDVTVSDGGLVLKTRCENVIEHRKAKEPFPENLSFPELIQFETVLQEKPVKLYGLVYKPPNFDPSKRYPTIIYGYGGPHAQLVTDDFTLSTHIHLQLWCSQGYVVALMDPLGHARRGIEFEAPLKWKMGQIEADQQALLVDALVKKGLTDPKRVCVTGWSYGGYMSLLCLAQRPDVFKIAISCAPVTKLQFYDTAWTERYMGLPDENAAGYEKASMLNMVDTLPDEANRLVLVHGFIDENVHLIHTTSLIDAIIAANKPYAFQLFPSERHGIQRPQSSIYQDVFILQHLQAHL